MSGKAELYEDDGISLSYRKGAFAVTPLAVDVAGDKVTFTVLPRKGTFDGVNLKRNVRAVWHEEGGAVVVQERSDVAVVKKVVFEQGG